MHRDLWRLAFLEAVEPGKVDNVLSSNFAAKNDKSESDTSTIGNTSYQATESDNPLDGTSELSSELSLDGGVERVLLLKRQGAQSFLDESPGLRLGRSSDGHTLAGSVGMRKGPEVSDGSMGVLCDDSAETGAMTHNSDSLFGSFKTQETQDAKSLKDGSAQSRSGKFQGGFRGTGSSARPNSGSHSPAVSESCDSYLEATSGCHRAGVPEVPTAVDGEKTEVRDEVREAARARRRGAGVVRSASQRSASRRRGESRPGAGKTVVTPIAISRKSTKERGGGGGADVDVVVDELNDAGLGHHEHADMGVTSDDCGPRGSFRSRSRACSKGKCRAKRSPRSAAAPSECVSDGESSEVELKDEDLDGFIEELFYEYTGRGTRDKKGRPLMNGICLRHFFSDFALTKADRVIVAADQGYADEIQRQVDMNFIYDLSKSEAKRGLCFQSFMQLLDQVMSRGMARTIARQRFNEYAGNARAMREHLSGDLHSSVRGA